MLRAVLGGVLDQTLDIRIVNSLDHQRHWRASLVLELQICGENGATERNASIPHTLLMGMRPSETRGARVSGEFGKVMAVMVLVV